MYIPWNAPPTADGEDPPSDAHTVLSRQFSENGTRNANIRTGLIVGIVLGVALVGFAVFFWYYRGSHELEEFKKLGELPELRLKQGRRWPAS
ncbi:uncharacterized protein J7T54_004230 [Emericellopsis cladophorae]|uniref:Uncharacterized protein n=1 Tax=Emericellopsis cladophorae TaxID=2686198 RepID=A0A9P9XYU4_9HYPO|nr:uncharacterized protein J7T54_004230 [Emericellopsis cladophorae]KAI6780098.1 hypothetical protein J7T54_004230 [Emericellopsis cladophorae]